MKIAVASGKGGTGKTTVTASLTAIWPEPLISVDLDVEEPNLHLFLAPEIVGSEKCYIEIPRVVENTCTGCGECAALCQFQAIAVLGGTAVAFPEMCHSCGGCFLACQYGALVPDKKEIGEVAWGHTEHGEFISGRLRVGEVMAPTLMRAVKGRLPENDGNGQSDATDVIIDAPPGVSCPAVNAVMNADAILLVTEPTAFGLYDLRLAVAAFDSLGIPTGVVINRADIGDDGVERFCASQQIPVIARIPYSEEAAQAYASGKTVAESVPALREQFEAIAVAARDLAAKGRGGIGA